MLPVPLLVTSGLASGINPCTPWCCCLACTAGSATWHRYRLLWSGPTFRSRRAWLRPLPWAGVGVPYFDSVGSGAHRDPAGHGRRAWCSDGTASARLGRCHRRRGGVGGGTALASHGVKIGIRLGINVSPEPVTNIFASLAEDLTVAGLVSFAVFHPLAAAIIATVLVVAGAVVA